MNKKLVLAIVVLAALLIGGFFALNAYIYEEKQAPASADYKDAEYFIEGNRVKLEDGMAETEIAPDSTGSPQAGSASKTITKYFGNEVRADLDGDGREDVVFLLTEDGGGSGTFYYVVAALNTERGYVGSEAHFLGDRIAPQTTEFRDGVLIVNYAERKPDEPMTALPSVGKSAYLTFDVGSMSWIVAQKAP